MNDVLLFDGVCNLCSWSTRFVIKRDPVGHFKFAALQSEIAREMARKHGISISEMNSFVLLTPDGAYKKSDAALRVVRHLTGLWPMLSVVLFVPRPIRDFLYDRIAAHRYRWFGRQKSCMVPAPEIRARFLAD